MPKGRFTEKGIRASILAKIKPDLKSSRAAHDVGYILLHGKIMIRVKIPNTHSKHFGPSKAKRLASTLKLDNDQFHDLISCPLSGEQYYAILETKITN